MADWQPPSVALHVVAGVAFGAVARARRPCGHWRGSHSRQRQGEIWPVLVLLLVSAAAMLVSQRKHAERWFSWLLIAAALGVLLGVEWIYLADFLRDSDWRRMNTVFKFSLQAWVLLGVSLGAMLPVLWQSRRRRRGLYGSLWHAGLVVLLAGALIYPLAAVPARVQERFSSGSPARNTLDGTAYMEYAVYDPPGGASSVAMSYDRQALSWMWEHIEGNPVIAEAPVDFYRAGVAHRLLHRSAGAPGRPPVRAASSITGGASSGRRRAAICHRGSGHCARDHPAARRAPGIRGTT